MICDACHYWIALGPHCSDTGNICSKIAAIGRRRAGDEDGRTRRTTLVVPSTRASAAASRLMGHGVARSPDKARVREVMGRRGVENDRFFLRSPIDPVSFTDV